MILMFYLIISLPMKLNGWNLFSYINWANAFYNSILVVEVLRGECILEVPKQYNPIPSKILDKANELKIIIRDSEGNVY